MEKKSFHCLLWEAWSIARSNRLLWLFGGVVALAALLQTTLLARWIPTSSPEALLGLFQHDPARFVLYASSIFIICTLIRLFGKANLILSLDVAQRAKENVSSESKQLSPREMLWNFFKAVSLEFSLFAFLLVMATIFALPPAFASWYKEAAVDPLLIFSGVAFVVIALIALLLSELAFFYLLLGKLGIRASFENAYMLLCLWGGRIIVFGIYCLGLLFLFTFSLNLLILLIEVFLRVPAVTLGISFFSLMGFSVLYQALWFFFFKDIAAPPKIKEGVEIAVSGKVPESPVA